MAEVRICDACDEVFRPESGFKFIVQKHRYGGYGSPTMDQKDIDLCVKCSPFDSNFNRKAAVAIEIEE